MSAIVTPAPSWLPVPHRFKGRLGSSPYGETCLVTEKPSGRLMVAKVLDQRAQQLPYFATSFRRESFFPTLVDSPYVVKVERFISDPQMIILMNYIHGPSLIQMIHNSYLDSVLCQLVALDLACALEAVHAAGIVHGDIKPANLIFRKRHLTLIDFGYSVPFRHLDASVAQGAAMHFGEKVSTELLAPGPLKPDFTPGTKAYMAPEQLAAEWLDERTDIFAAGVTLYQMLTGEYPFGWRYHTEVCLNHGTVPPRISDGTISDKWAKIITAATEKERGNRIQSATQLKNALEGVMG
jgi:serine/threonine protein kinase